MRHLLAIAAILVALVAPFSLHAEAPAEKLTRSPIAGTAQGEDFEWQLPTGGRLTAVQVNRGRYRNGAAVLKGLKFFWTDAEGKAAEKEVGPCTGRWLDKVELAEGVELIGISGQHGLVLDSIRFHFSDGKSSSLLGGEGGDDRYHVVLATKEKKVRGSVRGVFGKSAEASLAGIGLILAPVNDAAPELEPAPAPGAPAAPAGPPLVLTVRGDVDAEFAPTAGRLTALFYECYPSLLERFDNPKKPASRQITIVMKRGMKVPAYCSGAEISVSVDWLKKNPNDVALLTHELTHAVQSYARGAPGWLVEGIADYARQKYGPKEQPGWGLPAKLTERQKHTDSYRTTARFLVWLDAKHPGLVDKIHRHLQDGEYQEIDFRTETGKPVEALWQECVKELGM